MNSNLKYLFLAMQARIASIVDDNDKPVFRFIDHDLGYMDEDIPAISYPAVLIDMNSFQYTNMSANCQMASGAVILKIVFAPYSSTSQLTPLQWRDKANGFYDLEEQLHRLLQGWVPSYPVLITPADPEASPPSDAVYADALEYFGAFDRESARTDAVRKDLRIRRMSYNIAFEDYGTSLVPEYVPATPVFTEEYIPPAELVAL